ncbi:hypothetical protein E3N88_28832 [Mikania micrantha]|uniref:Uncharacterized protein n=1 Tax=Mikania micrantha TaxID=192012 RepID=A0A5N6N152_9ASTR|nr:hypothetical protein E3N88_28832 [Mikania micrantha]
MREMMNVGENRVQNGVLDCPESIKEEKSLSIGRKGLSRFPKNFAVREAKIDSPSRYATDEAVEQVNPFIRFHARRNYFFFLLLLRKPDENTYTYTIKTHILSLLKPRIATGIIITSSDRYFEVRNPSD